MSLSSPFNINDLTLMSSFLYSTVDKMMLIEFSSFEQNKVSNYFHIHKTGLVMKLLRFPPRYFFRYTLFTHKLTDVFSPAFTLCSKTKPKELIPNYSVKLNNTRQTLPTLPPPTFIQSKNYFLKNYSISLNLLSKSIRNVFLKVVSATVLLFCFVCPKESNLRTKKNAFHFTSKGLFILEIIKF